MARKGPGRVPDNVRALRGTLRSTTPRALKLPPKAPRPPTWLDREAKAEWHRVVPMLDRMGVLAEVDRAIVATYCSMWSLMVQAERALMRDGLMSPRADREAKHPLWQVWREAATQVRELAKELYLTPTARIRSEIPNAGAAAPDDDQALDLLD